MFDIKEKEKVGFVPKIIVPRIDGTMIKDIKLLTKENDEYDFSVYSYDPDDQKVVKIVEKWKSEKLVKPYIEDHGPIRNIRKNYLVEDGRFVMQELKIPPPDSGKVWDTINIDLTDNFFVVIDEDITFNNGIDKVNRWKGRIIVDGGTSFEQVFKFDEVSSMFVNPSDFGKVLFNAGGAKVAYESPKLQMIRLAMQKTSTPISRNISQNFGMDGKTIYRSPSSVITNNGVKEGDDLVIDLSDIAKARNLDIKIINTDEFKKVGKHIANDLLNVHERYPIDCLFGFTFLAPIASQIVNSKKWSGGRIGLWITGSSQCGKSHTALLFQNFFGEFMGDKSTFGWGGTPLGTQDGGYYFKDAIFMVDDFKIATFQSIHQVIMVLQNYTDGTSRTRFNMSSGHVEEGKPIRGSLLITGEDLLDDVGSIMNRYHVVRMDKVYKNKSAYSKTKDYTEFYSGFMGRYIAWLLKDPKSVDKIVVRIEKWKSELLESYSDLDIDRIAQSFAYNLVGFEMFCRFLEKNGFISMEKQIEMVKIHKNNLFGNIDAHIEGAKEATVSEIFINTLADLINSGAVKIYETSEKKPKPRNFKDDYVGFDDFDEYLYFWGVPVLNAVNKAAGLGKGLNNSKENLINELVKEGIMDPHIKKDGTFGGNLFPKSLYGKTQKTWRILKSALGYGREDMVTVVYEDDDVIDDDW